MVQNPKSFGLALINARPFLSKQGDHATNRVNTLYYGKNGVTDGKVTYTYDGMGNVISVNENGIQSYKYSYDKIGRIISENDLYNDKEICYTYDNNGNILTKSVNGTVTEYKYQDGSDRLMSFGAETFVYDNMGNPTIYRDMSCEWEKGRQLKSITVGANTIAFSYDAFGIRSGKTVGGVTTYYVHENGKLLRQITGNEVIDFIYGADGIIGFKIGNASYLYRKNLFGDVTEIYNSSGVIVGKYRYTAFGECKVELNTNGIADKNPIRYRGYYYDDETGWYYLKSRYYDPKVGRFITIDDISYIDPETINGLNLYAYCGNNPVMNVDPNGEFFISLLIAIAVGAIVGGVVGGVSATIKGDNFWGGFFSGALVGGVLGGAMVLGGAAMLAIAGKAVAGIGILTTFTAKASFLIGSAAISYVASVGAGMGAYAIQESINGRKIDYSEMIRQGVMTGFKGLLSFGTGMVLATAGAYPNLLAKSKLPFKQTILRSLDLFAQYGIPRAIASFIIQTPWKLMLK